MGLDIELNGWSKLPLINYQWITENEQIFQIYLEKKNVN